MAKASIIPSELETASAIAGQPSYVGDEFWGQGGSYLLDPATGIRTRMEDPAVVPTQSPEPEVTDGTL